MKQLPSSFSVMPLKEQALGGGVEGASRTTREMMTWSPQMGPADAIINPIKVLADARTRDVVMNDGYVQGAINSHRDSIVGNQYRLNAAPNWMVLGATEEWGEEFQTWAEAHFNLTADSDHNWLHSSARFSFTGMIRVAIAQFMMSGEVLMTADWKREAGRPCSTALEFISPDRLSNPDGKVDTDRLRRGIELDTWGAPVAAWIQSAHPYDFLNQKLFNWRRVEFRKPWGRLQVLHIADLIQPDQTRGVSDMVSVLKQIKMTKSFQDVTLQNAVINASYAAAIESELPSEMIHQALGAGGGANWQAMAGGYLDALSAYVGAAGAIRVDGAKIPHLFPNSKLRMQPMGTPGGIGTQFEESLLRYIASGLGLSYEQFSRDYSKVNYSSARAGANEAFKFQQGRKKLVADRVATEVYALWLEEKINEGVVPLIPGHTKRSMIDLFYTPLMKEAFVNCGWIGAGRGQIDELKETQSAMMRIKAGLSTYEAECARLGLDFRNVFRQLAREQSMMEELSLTFTLDASKPGANERQKTVRGDNASASETTTDEEETV